MYTMQRRNLEQSFLKVEERMFTHTVKVNTDLLLNNYRFANFISSNILRTINTLSGFYLGVFRGKFHRLCGPVIQMTTIFAS